MTQTRVRFAQTGIFTAGLVTLHVTPQDQSFTANETPSAHSGSPCPADSGCRGLKVKGLVSYHPKQPEAAARL